MPDGTLYEGQGVATVFADLTTVAGTRKAFGVAFLSSTVFMASVRVKEKPAVFLDAVDTYRSRWGLARPGAAARRRHRHHPDPVHGRAPGEYRR